MRRFVTMALLVCLAFLQMNAEVLAKDDVTLVVSADGATKDEAIKMALRSAIEQTYGAFVSSNTAILNDELVEDEVVTVSSGNVKEYKELTSNKLPNGRTYVTLQATVSVSNLIKFAQSKGTEVEFDGANLVMNMQLEELNIRSQEKVLENLLTQLTPLTQNGFNYSLKLRDVEEWRRADYKTKKMSTIGHIFHFEIKASRNRNIIMAIELIKNTLSSLNVPSKQKIATMQYKDYRVNPLSEIEKGYTLRYSENTESLFKSIASKFNAGINNFCIEDGKFDCNVVGSNNYKWDSQLGPLKCARVYADNTIFIERKKQVSRIEKWVTSDELGEYKDFKIKTVSNL